MLSKKLKILYLLSVFHFPKDVINAENN